ncbi:MAG: hypothetical protein RMK84_18870 [Oscillochloridaceae bacterium]|nr:hypothetical protein [Chloroflexaceae bacterium]MDW8392188.1 hypothetical protein [Oscillochloridaceae bacterium]
MSTPDQTAITTRARAGIRRNAAAVAAGVGGASVIALLAVASTLPLLTGGMAPAAVAAWLAGLGSNALAGWLTDWAQRNVARLDDNAPAAEQALLEQFAADLTAQIAQSRAIAADVEMVLLQTDALSVAIEALADRGDQQLRLLQRFLADAQDGRAENAALHAATVAAVRAQAQALLDANTRGNAALAAQLREVLAAVQRAEEAARKPAPAPGGIFIGGSVGAFQKIDVSGGSVGSIVGKQVTYYGAPSTSGAVPGQDDVDEARELLGLQRQNLAAYARRAARGDTEAARQAAAARDEIARLKAQLRRWGQSVADEPGDAGEVP